MSAALHKPLSEAAPISSTFSYAQAAKGRSPSVPSSLPSGKALPENTELSARRTSVPDPETTMISHTRPLAEESASLDRDQIGSNTSDRSELASYNDAKSVLKNASSTLASGPSVQPQVTVSTPSSPSFGTASTSTLPKEDELSSTANGSSDSTWDKQSQGSQNGKNIEKIESDKVQSTIPTWTDEGSSSVSLKEAPPPAVNFWQHRKEIQDANAKRKQVAGLQTPKPVSLATGSRSTSTPLKTPESPVDMKKQDKKRAKANSIHAEERPASGNVREGGKTADGKPRGGEEAPEKGHRASRMPDAEKSITASVVTPPHPGDATSWPTPDSAQGEEKKKAQERAEKGEKERTSAATKSHGKEKWMPVPYVPSAVFNTPLPQTRRGGRLARGGREGGTRGGTLSHGNHGSEKQATGPTSGFVSAVSAKSNERGREDSNASRNSPTSSRPKRAASAGPSTVREQRKIGEPTLSEKPREPHIGLAKGTQNSSFSATESRRASAATQTDDHRARRSSTAASQQANDSGYGQAQGSHNMGEREERYQIASQDTYTNQRPVALDRRNEGSSRPLDYSREFHGQSINRERGEGRVDRSRGGFRGKGAGSHGFPNSSPSNGQSFSHAHSSQHPTSTPNQSHKSQSSHERHGSQSQNTQYNSSQPVSRNFRSGSRSQSIPHPTAYGKFSTGPNAPHLGPPHLSNLETDLANAYSYQPGQQGIMSAMPYNNAYVEQVSLFGMVSMQMEYYFSVDNLCKDMFLRKHMDSQGFVFLSVLTKFNRMKQLTQDLDLVRYVCLYSPNIEFRMGADGIDRLRKREGWQQWVLNKEERDPSAQNDDPIPVHQPRPAGGQGFAIPPSFDDRQASLPQLNTTYPVTDEVAYPLQATVPASHNSNSPVPTADRNSVHEPCTQTPLSAAVPAFSPAASVLNNHVFANADVHPPLTSSFTDEQVESLMIVVRKPLNPSGSSPPFPPTSTRTFSNGSIDSRTIHDELSKFEDIRSRTNVSGDSGSDNGDLSRAQRSKSPLSLSSPSRQLFNNASPVFWVKDKETPIDSLPNDLTHESYNIFRRNALKNREQSLIGICHHDMDILYQFWSHFLIRNFNTRMYEEFRQIAFEDAAKHESNAGIKNLIQFYDESILSQKVVSDDIARDFVDLVKSESKNTDRPAFDKLRAAWRNGAFNMKNRKKIDNIIDAELKAELER